MGIIDNKNINKCLDNYLPKDKIERLKKHLIEHQKTGDIFSSSDGTIDMNSDCFWLVKHDVGSQYCEVEDGKGYYIDFINVESSSQKTISVNYSTNQSFSLHFVKWLNNDPLP